VQKGGDVPVGVGGVDMFVDVVVDGQVHKCGRWWTCLWMGEQVLSLPEPGVINTVVADVQYTK